MKWLKYLKKESVLFNNLEELPEYNWRKANQGELNYLVRSGKASEHQLREHKITLLDEYINRYGFQPHFKKLVRERKNLYLLKCEYIITGQKSLVIQMKILEKQIDQILKERGDEDDSKVKAYIDKFMGFRLNLQEITVVEYRAYLDLINEHGKKN